MELGGRMRGPLCPDASGDPPPPRPREQGAAQDRQTQIRRQAPSLSGSLLELPELLEDMQCGVNADRARWMRTWVLGSAKPELKPQFLHTLAVWSRISELTSLGLALVCL